MTKKPLPKNENIYETECPILYAMEQDGFVTRTQYNTIPPTVEYSLAERNTFLLQGPNSASFIRQRTFSRSILCAGGRKASLREWRHIRNTVQPVPRRSRQRCRYPLQG